MSHRVQIKFTRSQAVAALESLAMTIEDDPGDDEARAAHRKLERALSRRDQDRPGETGTPSGECEGCVCPTEHDGDYGSAGHPGPCPPHTCGASGNSTPPEGSRP